MIQDIKKIEFTAEMKDDYTILAPNMLPVHFKMIAEVMKSDGYKFEILTNEGKEVVDAGLKYVHNDTCYPALLVIGQMISALESGKYDVNKVALMITQTGGGCRASNYIHLLRKALAKAGFPFVPVVSFSTSKMEENSGFRVTTSLLRKLVSVVAYGDLLMLLKNQVKPYEITKGETDLLVLKWQEKLSLNLAKNSGLSLLGMKSNFKKIVESFSSIKTEFRDKIKVGIVGEIYIKYASLGNNGLEDFLHSQNCEYMVPGLMGFLMYTIENNKQDIQIYGGSKIKHSIVSVALAYMEKIENYMISEIKSVKKFIAPSTFSHLKSLTTGIVGLGNKMGEGWLLPAEMMELCEQGYENIVCAQPFGCLPNHIVGKGAIRAIKEHYAFANITAIDYDPGAARVNQENRIKLMLAMAKHNESELKIADKNSEIPQTNRVLNPAGAY